MASFCRGERERGSFDATHDYALAGQSGSGSREAGKTVHSATDYGPFRVKQKKLTVEESRIIDLDLVLRHTPFRTAGDGSRVAMGAVTRSMFGNVVFRVEYIVLLRPADVGTGALRLIYFLRRAGHEVEMDEEFGLVSRRPHFGGLRYFVTCPCGRRTVKLYLPPGGTRFRCRECHGLTYESRQRHNKRIDFYLKNPRAAKAEWTAAWPLAVQGNLAAMRKVWRAIRIQCEILRRQTGERRRQ